MDNRFNTIAGWVLGGGIVLLGASLVTGEYWKSERPEKMGYPIAGVVEEGEGGGEEAEPPIAALLQTADATAGEASFRKCGACHNAAQGGPNQLGPNLWATVGANIAHVPGFAYSEALRSHGGQWTFENLNEWLRSPRTFAPNTKMTFAGLSDPQERANVIAYLNRQGSNLPLPPPPAADSPAEAAAEQSAQNAQGDLAAPQPELNAATTPRTEGTVKGPGAPDTSGRAAQRPGGH
ncbi:MAG TPA: cytochrome c family protein [Allosphingosinicella sp.]|nr:cytochrome c family protein [Allosphingosinicella sp.]